MDLTEGTIAEKNERAKKMMLWFGIGSLIMSFAGLTSAVIVSSKRPDWLRDFELPEAFYISTLIILTSSVTLFLAKQSLKKDKRGATSFFLWITFVLGLTFIWSQFSGFSEIIDLGYNFTGPTSNITMSYIFLIAFVHGLHIAVGLLSLLIVIINHIRNKYNSENMLGFELSSTFWHFVDILWLFLFVFLYFIR